MKNIHILPTDKPSRLLYFGTSKELTLQVNPATFRVFERSTQHIYITSDEEIKDGDYFWKPDCNMIFKAEYTPHKGCQKVILTTDTTLIADGVQAIDDEFLEWFVKNPSCESVDVKQQHQYHSSKEFYIDADYVDCSKEQYQSIKKEIPTCPLRILYKIIIPKEEPKQYPKTFKELFANTGIEPTTDESGNMQYNFKATIKQETLEEAAENYSKNFNYAEDSSPQIDFVEGAKWQAERMYNDIKLFTEELKDKIDSFEYSVNRNSYILDYIEEWFEQFKNK
jgi:hypothetical protein